MKKSLAMVLAFSLLSLSLGSSAQALWTHGYSGQSAYTTQGGGVYGDRAGGQYVQNLHDGMVGNNLASSGTVYRDEWAWESDLTSTFADSKQFFSFAGHGLGYWDFSNGDGAASHFYTLNSSTNFHTSEFVDLANAQWDEIRWGDDEMRWATMYQCNWLRNGGSTIYQNKIWDMFQGVHLMMGFASIMYLDSREASWYAARMGAGWEIKDSFFDAAAKYQPQLPYNDTDPNGKIHARVMGYSADGNDKWDSSTAAAPSTSTSSNFSTWTYTITINP